MTLNEYVVSHTVRGECACGKCFDRGENPDPTGHVADVIFFKVAAADNPKAYELLKLVQQHKGEFSNIDPFDGREYSYIELGAWLGSQDTALRFVGLAALLGLGQLLTPRVVLGNGIDDETVMQMAGAGLVGIIKPKHKGAAT